MEKFKEKWGEPSASKIVAFLILIAGIISFVLGFAAWKNPHLDWESFKQSFVIIGVSIANELARFMSDPFAFIGLVVMIVSSIVIHDGIKKLFKL